MKHGPPGSVTGMLQEAESKIQSREHKGIEAKQSREDGDGQKFGAGRFGRQDGAPQECGADSAAQGTEDRIGLKCMFQIHGVYLLTRINRNFKFVMLLFN